MSTDGKGRHDSSWFCGKGLLRGSSSFFFKRVIYRPSAVFDFRHRRVEWFDLLCWGDLKSYEGVLRKSV